MKTIMRNTFLAGALLLGTTSLLTAQQTVVGTVAPAAGSGSTNSITPVAGMVTATGNGYAYSYNDRQIQDADLKSKEVSKEISTPKGADVYIENSSRNVVVKTWDQQKVKITTTVYYEGETKLTDDEWLDRVGLSLKTLGSSVKIKSGNGNGGGGFMVYGSGSYSGTLSSSSVFNVNGQNIGTAKTAVKKIITITIPAGSKLDIESKYADVTVPAGVGDLNVDISNGNLEAENLGKFILRSKYANINVGDVKTAEVEFTNGRFSAKNIDDLDIESKYSTIEMAAAKKLVIRSTNDEYEMEEAGEVRGKKAYGNLRITKLEGSLDVDGINADIKIRNVGPSLSSIKIDDKYADVRIPLREKKNYAVDFTGAYSSVYGNFEKVPVTDKEKEKTAGTVTETPAAGTVSRGGGGGTYTVAPRAYNLSASQNIWGESGNGPSHFTATVGDGRGLKIEMKCQNCTVDFK